MKYQWILFDADETLFHFDDKAGLQHMFQQYDVAFSEEDYLAYKYINNQVWIDYQNGDTTADILKTKRFLSWSERLSISPLQLNSEFLKSMVQICKPLAGVETLLQEFSSHVKMAIVTNGFSELQKARLDRSGLSEYISAVITSEHVGVAKPDSKIFHYTLEQIDHQDKASVLMVGDNVHSDILGANKVGIDSCWLNRKGEVAPNHIKPTYQIKEISELSPILFSNVS